jgi:Ran GTPase-activating protein (RanGAP) involved in mRNA processing and transport
MDVNIKAFDDEVSLRGGGAADGDTAVAVEWEDTGAMSTLRGVSQPDAADPPAPTAPAGDDSLLRSNSSGAKPTAASNNNNNAGTQSPRSPRAAGTAAAPHAGPITLLPPKAVTKGERDYSHKLLEQAGDKVLHMQWVTKINPVGEAQARLIVVGLYRIYSIKRRWNGRKEVRRDGHYSDLAEVVTDSVDHIKLCFTHAYMKEPFVIDIHGQGVGVSLPQEIIKALRQWAFDLPVRKMPTLRLERTLVPNEKIDFTSTQPPPHTMGGFAPLYKAMCNYNALRVSEQVIKFVEQLGVERTNLWLNRCSKIRHPNLIALRPIVAALKFNRHFKTVMMTRIPRPATLNAFAVAAQSNATLCRLIISGCAVRADGAILLGRAIAENKRCNLSHIDLSRNPIGDRGLLGLVDGLRTLRHSLNVLRLAQCELTHKSLAPLFFAFTDVAAGILTSAMHEVDIADNNGGLVTTNAIINWLRVGAIPEAVDGGAAAPDAPSERESSVVDGAGGAGKRHPPSVRRLVIAACKLDLPRLISALRRAPLMSSLERLLCGSTKFTVESAAALGRLVASATALKVVDVSQSQIDSTMLSEILAGVVENRSAEIGSIELDLSMNNIGASGCMQLLSMLNKTNHVGSLNLRRNKIGIDGHIAFFDLLASPECGVLRSLEELMLTFEDVRKPGSNAKVDEMLAKLVACLEAKKSALHKLVLYGNSEKYCLGRHLVPFFKAVAASSVSYLDVSGQLLEDKGAAALAELVKTSRFLNTLVLDDNHFTAAGFDAIRQAMETSYTLCNMPYPRRDIRRAAASGRKEAKKLHEVLMKIKALLKRNRKREENLKVTWVNDDDDDEEGERGG